MNVPHDRRASGGAYGSAVGAVADAAATRVGCSGHAQVRLALSRGHRSRAHRAILLACRTEAVSAGNGRVNDAAQEGAPDGVSGEIKAPRSAELRIPSCVLILLCVEDIIRRVEQAIGQGG